MNDSLIDEAALKAWAGFIRKGDLDRWFRENRIPFFYGKGGALCTTIEAIDEELIGRIPRKHKQIDFA